MRPKLLNEEPKNETFVNELDSFEEAKKDSDCA